MGLDLTLWLGLRLCLHGCIIVVGSLHRDVHDLERSRMHTHLVHLRARRRSYTRVSSAARGAPTT